MQQSHSITRRAGDDERAQSPLVLIIEDYPATQHVISYLLTMQGYQPVCTANGREALEWIESALHGKQYPAAILLDLLMPVMDGIQFLTHLRAVWRAPVPLPPTILLTVDQGNYDYLACTDVLQKPFHITDLLEMLKRVSNQRQNCTAQAMHEDNVISG